MAFVSVSNPFLILKTKRGGGGGIWWHQQQAFHSLVLGRVINEEKILRDLEGAKERCLWKDDVSRVCCFLKRDPALGIMEARGSHSLTLGLFHSRSLHTALFILKAMMNEDLPPLNSSAFLSQAPSRALIKSNAQGSPYWFLLCSFARLPRYTHYGLPFVKPQNDH